MTRSRHLWIGAVLALCSSSASGCPHPRGSSGGEGAEVSGSPYTGSRNVGSSMPAGTTCEGRDDCASDQVCVGGICRYRLTSTAGEVLATAAAAQVEAGDVEGAVRTYDQSIEAYRSAHAPVPPNVVCEAASAALRTARAAEGRELAAKRADSCFRSSLPGDRARQDVRASLARLRYDGLDLARFDRDEPADRFFTAQTTRPTVDAVEIAIDMPDRENPGYAELRDLLRGEPARRAIADCFVQDWELRHERHTQAALVLKYATRLRDMGEYDVYEPTVQVDQSTPAEDGFEPCLARALSSTLAPGPRIHRVVAWQEPFDVAARLQ